MRPETAMIPGIGGEETHSWTDSLDRTEARITAAMARHAVTASRISLGIIFLWFGGLKLVPGWSPAEGLACRTIHALTAGLADPEIIPPALGIWECLVGLGLLTGLALRPTLLALFVHMAGTATPLALFPAEVFTRFPIGLTLEGQYIVKNLALVSAALVVGATVRGGSLNSERCREALIVWRRPDRESDRGSPPSPEA